MGGAGGASPRSVEYVVFDFDDFAGVAVDEDGVVAVTHPDIFLARILKPVKRVVGKEEIGGQQHAGDTLADREAAIGETARPDPGAHVETVRRAEHGVE